MSHDTLDSTTPEAPDFVVPGTCFVRQPSTHPGIPASGEPRDPAARSAYLSKALGDLPRLLAAVDRNPISPTYGCFDRQYWHYRTASFPSEMYQEAVLPLALAYRHPLPGNRFHRQPRVRELAVAGMRFAVRTMHADGSCDDYYPMERALGAAVFSLAAVAEAYQQLELHDGEIRDGLHRRAWWVAEHDESGRLANHHALAALGLLRAAVVTGDRSLHAAGCARLRDVLAWQRDEGWFEEYGGADPGYQTVTIDCLAKCRPMIDDEALRDAVDGALPKAVRFARWFLHPDGSYGGEYGSRGTHVFYPAGFERLTAHNADAADLADGHLRALQTGRNAEIADDRLLAHRTTNLIEAHLAWSPVRPKRFTPPSGSAMVDRDTDETAGGSRFFADAGMLVHRTAAQHVIISAARGGVFKRFDGHGRQATDAGLILETTDGRVAVSQRHDRSRDTRFTPGASPTLTVAGPLDWIRFERATPAKQAAFHLGMITVGRWCRTLVRQLLQRRLITAGRPCPVRLTRRFELVASDLPVDAASPRPLPDRLRVTDTIELLDDRTRVRRMAFGADQQTAYVATCGVYQDAVLQPWMDLMPYVDRLNRQRRVEITRTI